MYVEKDSERDAVLDTVWLANDEREQLSQSVAIKTSLELNVCVLISIPVTEARCH